METELRRQVTVLDDMMAAIKAALPADNGGS